MGNVKFVLFDIDYSNNEEELLCILQNREAFVIGTGFGFDVTRAEYIGIGKVKIMLRISVCIAPEP